MRGRSHSFIVHVNRRGPGDKYPIHAPVIKSQIISSLYLIYGAAEESQPHICDMYLADVAQSEETLEWIASVHVKLASQLM